MSDSPNSYMVKGSLFFLLAHCFVDSDQDLSTLSIEDRFQHTGRTFMGGFLFIWR